MCVDTIFVTSAYAIIVIEIFYFYDDDAIFNTHGYPFKKSCYYMNYWRNNFNESDCSIRVNKPARLLRICTKFIRGKNVARANIIELFAYQIPARSHEFHEFQSVGPIRGVKFRNVDIYTRGKWSPLFVIVAASRLKTSNATVYIYIRRQSNCEITNTRIHNVCTRCSWI